MKPRLRGWRIVYGPAHSAFITGISASVWRYLDEFIAARQADPNKNHTKTDWRVTTADARIKLKRPYPQFE